MNNQDLLHLALASLLTGGAGYAGMRFARDLPQVASVPEKPKNQLDITLPEARMPKMANDESAFRAYVLPALVGGGGLTAGFTGASSLYEHFKRKQLEGHISDVEQNYLNALQQAHGKIASETPLIDNFLKGYITKCGEDLSKIANQVGMYNTPISDIIQGTGESAWDGFKGTTVGKAIIGGALLTLLGSAGATYGIGKRMDQNKAQTNMQTTLPTDIKVNVTH
jgi:hypothetical protein